MKDYGNLVSDTWSDVGCLTMITHPDKYHIPILLYHGLPYIQHWYPTNEEYANLH